MWPALLLWAASSWEVGGASGSHGPSLGVQVLPSEGDCFFHREAITLSTFWKKKNCLWGRIRQSFPCL